MLNKKGNMGEIALTVLIAGMLFVSGMLFINPLRDSYDSFRTDVGCSDVTISDGTKVLCLGADLVNPLFILMVVSTAGGFVVSKFLV